MPIEIQPVTAATREQATALLIRFFGEEGFATPPARIAQNLDLMLADPACWCAVAVEGGAPAAVITVSTIRLIEEGRIGEIGDLYVLPEYRRRGLARLLIERAQAWCREQGCSAVEVTTTPTGERRHRLSAFYARLGFAPTGRTIASATLWPAARVAAAIDSSGGTR